MRVAKKLDREAARRRELRSMNAEHLFPLCERVPVLDRARVDAIKAANPGFWNRPKKKPKVRG